MRRNPTTLLVFTLGLLVLSGCSSPSTGGDGDRDPPATQLDCERVGYPCRLSDVPQSVLETEGRYVEQLLQRLDGGATMEDALAWIRNQPDVASVEADAASIVFRVDGGQPSWILRPLVPATAPATAPAPLEALRLAPNGVVGDGTDRDEDEPDNRKKALVLAPFFFQFGSDEYLADVPSQLRSLEETKGVADYNHEFKDVDFVIDNLVTPGAFASRGDDRAAGERDWRDYDAIFVHSHGGQYAEDTFVATGVVQAFDPGIDGEAKRICDILMEPYAGAAGEGVRCGTVIIDDGDDEVYYRTLGITTDLFRARYPNGLDKTIVLMGGCLTLARDDMADALTGDASAYLGWTDAVETSKGGETITALLDRLIERGEPVETALAAVCRDVGCGGPAWDGDYNGNPRLELRGSPQAKKLRLYDLPTLRDPESPTSTTRLEDGATLRIRGVPGDGENDELELVVDVAGVIDPENPGGGGGPAALIATASHGSPADLYPLRFLVDDEEVGLDDLGDHRDPSASVVQLDETRYRYAFTAALPFDLPEDGKDVTLKVEVGLPEDGAEARSDHEVDVRLEGAPCSWSLTFSGTGYAGSYGGDFVALVRGTPTGGRTNLILQRSAQTRFPGVAIQLLERLPEAPAELRLGASTGEDRAGLDLDGFMVLTFPDADGTVFQSSHGNPCCGANPTATLPPPTILTITTNDELQVIGSASGSLFRPAPDEDPTFETGTAQLEFLAGDGGSCTIFDPVNP